MQYKAFIADILNPKSDSKCEYIKEGVLILKGENIVEIGKKSLLKRPLKKQWI